MPHLATCGRDYAGLMFELTLTLTLTLTAWVYVNLRQKSHSPFLHFNNIHSVVNTYIIIWFHFIGLSLV